MASKTVVNVTRRCGCDESFDSAGMFPYAIETKVKTWKKTDCLMHDAGADRRRKLYFDQMNAQEYKQAREAARRFGLPEFTTSSPKSAEWGTRARHKLIFEAHAVWAGTAKEFADKILAPARVIDSPGWWIDRRGMDPANLAQILMAATVTPPETVEG